MAGIAFDGRLCSLSARGPTDLLGNVYRVVSVGHDGNVAMWDLAIDEVGPGSTSIRLCCGCCIEAPCAVDRSDAHASRRLALRWQMLAVMKIAASLFDAGTSERRPATTTKHPRGRTGAGLRGRRGHTADHVAPGHDHAPAPGCPPSAQPPCGCGGRHTVGCRQPVPRRQPAHLGTPGPGSADAQGSREAQVQHQAKVSGLEVAAVATLTTPSLAAGPCEGPGRAWSCGKRHVATHACFALLPALVLSFVSRAEGKQLCCVPAIACAVHWQQAVERVGAYALFELKTSSPFGVQGLVQGGYCTASSDGRERGEGAEASLRADALWQCKDHEHGLKASHSNARQRH